LKAFLLTDKLHSIDPRLIWVWMKSHGRYGAFFRVPGSPTKEGFRRGIPYKLYPRCLWFAAPHMEPTDDDYRVLRESFYKWRHMTTSQIAEAEFKQQVAADDAAKEQYREKIDPLVESSLRKYGITKKRLGAVAVATRTAKNEPRSAR